MPSRRHTSLGRMVALVLLLWTAVDLTNSGLCALDNEAAATSVHVDDCFCCSHCVDVSAIFPTTVVSPVTVRHAPLVVPAPRIFGSPLYHPPLI